MALQLRFQAELNQMESIQEAERQLHQISQIRDVVTARNETAVYAQVRLAQARRIYLVVLPFLFLFHFVGIGFQKSCEYRCTEQIK